MKIQFLAFCLVFSIASFAQSNISFKQTSHNFGKIKKGVHKSVVFNYTNNSTKPAVIEFANAE